MRFVYAALGVVVAGGVAGWFWPAQADPMPMDTPTSVGGIETVCTGVGAEAQQDPRWQAYPVRSSSPMAGPSFCPARMSSWPDSGGRPIANVDCAGSWVLFKVEPGSYKVTATLTGQAGGSRSASFSTSRSGQKLVVLDFSVPANK